MPARNQIDQALRIILTIEAPFSLDLIVRTPKRLKRDWEDGDSFLREVLAKGKVLHEKTDGSLGSAKPRTTYAARGVWNIASPHLHDLICFHCQQSAEKYIKALFQEWGLVPPRIHDLVKLLILLLPHDATLRSLKRRLASLSNYAVDFRYPGDNASKKQALASLRHAENIRQEIRTRLGLSS